MGGTDDEVLALLAAYPQAAEDKQDDLNDSDNNPDAESETLQEGDPLLLSPLPLHYAIIEMRPQKVLKALLDAYPDAAKKKNPQTRNLPLHDALEDALKRPEAEEVILLLLNAYPQAAKEKMKDGRLPIEVCAKNKASEGLMLALYKANPKSRVEGLLFLGMVLTNVSSDDVVLAVLQAYPEAASATFSTKSDVRILPLHIAHEETRSEELKKALLDAYPDAKEVENPFKTTLRLHKLLEDTEPDEDVLELIKNYPDAVGKRGRDGRRPLHIALMHKASQDVIKMLFHKYPQAAKERMEDGRLPIEVCAKRNMSKDLMLSLLEDDMPISKDGMPVEHCGSWFSCVSYNTEGAIGAVRCILSEKMTWWEDDFFCNHIHDLADVCDDQGRTALNLAAKGPRAVINEYLLFCGRYMLKSGPPEHRTATSVILRAQDYGDQSDYGVTFDKADKDKNGKLDRKELKAITVEIGLDPDLFLKGSKEGESISKGIFVGICKQQLGDGPREVPKLCGINSIEYPSEDAIANAVEMGRGGLKTIQDKFLKEIVLGKYAIVMGAGPRNLLQIFYQEQPKIENVRHILKQVFEAVKHLHEKKLMHGDIKMLNIIRLGIDNKLRLIDLDASARIVPSGGEEESFAGASAKFSSAILPPEMIYRIETEEQLEKFKKYWKSEIDEDLKKKVEPKLYKKQGTVKARYVVKSFRTEEGKPTTPVFEGLPYEDEELVHASENIDVWSLGVLAFTLLTGEPLIPSNLEDDCLSGTAMHLLKSWGTQPEVLTDRFKKIQDDAARDLVWKLLKQKPEERPTVASLLEEHPFFHPELSAGTEDQFREMKEYLQNITNQVETIHRNILVIKELSHKSQSELLRTRRVLLKGIFEATEVRTPTTFIILNNELPTAVDPSDEETKNKILEIIAREDGSGVSMKTKQATLTATAEGVEIDLEGDLKEYRDQFEDRIKWAKAIKNIGTNFAAGNIDEAFDNIKAE
ncbi:serine/threonine-protein kinase [Skeletonema marinoi]|uniref:Serine/threonine-protein kinase n=1 Tax=Skeletonema marinoi TaxID=267567 RepID=A0AAD8YIF3_9STRA|nr:serine/threonine-protein kinase [Skeletonema marinoi]